jgi:phage terminase large subunit GpA-like protein
MVPGKKKCYWLNAHTQRNKLIRHSKKRWMIERGEWRATEPFNGHAGFFIWAVYPYAPNATWGKIAAEFLESKGDPERLKTFVNSTLGQTWEEQGDQPDWALKARSGPYQILT